MNKLAQQTHLFLKTKLGSLKKQDVVLVACSGGPDSVALCRLLADLENLLSLQFVIGHVNHQTRGASSVLDEKYVRALGKKLGWRVLTRSGRISSGSGNLEEKLRVKRYDLLTQMAKKVRARAVLTAHTLDDQVETVLMNLFRGAGLDGAAGIPSLRNLTSKVALARPLLPFSKRELLAYLKRNDQGYRKDQTNKDLRLNRNWVRRRLLPALEERFPGATVNLGRFGLQAAETKEFLRRLVEGTPARKRPVSGGGKVIDFEKLSAFHPTLQREFLRQGLGKDLLTFVGIERLRSWMGQSQGPQSLLQLKQGHYVHPHNNKRQLGAKKLFAVVRNADRVRKRSRRQKTK